MNEKKNPESWEKILGKKGKKNLYDVREEVKKQNSKKMKTEQR